MSHAKKIRRRLEAAAIITGVDLGVTFARGAKGAALADVIAFAVVCGLDVALLFDGPRGILRDSARIKLQGSAQDLEVRDSHGGGSFVMHHAANS